MKNCHGIKLNCQHNKLNYLPACMSNLLGNAQENFNITINLIFEGKLISKL